MATSVIKDGQPGSKAIFKDSFLLHKLHSLSGVLPIGGFMAFHLVVNSYALRGETEFNVAARAISYLPFVQVVEWLLIFIPILFHSIYGFFITAEMRTNTGTYQYGRNWLYSLQRWSGVAAFAYIIFHVWETWGIKKQYEVQGGAMAQELGEQAISYASLVYRFSEWWYVAIYVLGIAAAAFHLGNGLFNFCIRWGITVGRAAQRVAAVTGWLIAIGLTGLGVATAMKYHGVAAAWPMFADPKTGGLGYEGKGPIQQQYKSLDELVKAKAEQSHSKEEKAVKSTGDPEMGDAATMSK